MSTRLPDLNDLSRYRPVIAELTEQVRAGDRIAVSRARDVLAELELFAKQIEVAYYAAGGDELDIFQLVFTLAGDTDLSGLIDELDEPEANRRAWVTRIEPRLRRQGWTGEQIAAERERWAVPA